MKKRKVYYVVAIISVFCLVLSGCHKHTFAEATCTEPAKCVECGETEGEALGHTTSFGICETCGEAVGKESADTISDALWIILDDIDRSVARASDSYDNTYTLYYDLKNAANELSNSKEAYELIISVCDQHNELDQLKSLSIKAMNSIPKAPSNDSLDELERYINDEGQYLEDFKEFSDEAIRITKIFE